MLKIIIIGALPSSLINFRGELIKSFVENDHKVITMASGATAAEIDSIESLGAKYIDYSVQRNGLNPIADLKTFFKLRKIFKAEKADLILAYTIKPVIWGGIAARLSTNAKFYGLVTGLGFAFQKSSLKRNLLSWAVSWLYRQALSKASGTIFQNPDNLKTFTDKGIINTDKAHRVNGSGVDLEYFSKSNLPIYPLVFLTVARLLGEKGLREYSQAARQVIKKYPDVVFNIVGPEDPSPDGIPLKEVNAWHKVGDIQYLGGKEDVRPFINECHVFVLASYHEGMPRTVLEAMAIGRPILTTNVPGCRETVISGENGFLVDKMNVEQLIDKMTWFIENQKQLPTMANKSHEFAKERYDVHKVNHELMKIMELK